MRDFAQIFGIPITCYFDDVGAIVPADMASAALRAFTHFCASLGISLKPGKSEAVRRVAFLGPAGFSPCRGNSWNLQVALPAEKAEVRAPPICAFIENGAISPAEMEGVIVKLCFSKSNLFGKFGRPSCDLYTKICMPGNIPPIYSRMNRGAFVGGVQFCVRSAYEVLALRIGGIALLSTPMRRPPPI